jgi:hypothetical protein
VELCGNVCSPTCWTDLLGGLLTTRTDTRAPLLSGAALTIADPTTEAAQPWWRHPFGMLQTNLREIDATLDVERVLDFIQAHGADAWLVNAGGILSFFPTNLPFQTRNPHLAQRRGGDLLGDAVRAAHARGVHLLARMDFSKVSARIAAEHPEWCYVSPTGQSQTVAGLVSVCPNGAYYQEKSFAALDEVIDRYPVDGFFFNWFGFNEIDYSKVYNGVCHCLSCQRAFHTYSGGAELPDGPASPTYGTWRAFSAATIADLIDRLRAHISNRRPHAFLLGRTADVIFHEANNALGRQLWHHATSEEVSAPRAYRPDVPVLVNAVAFMDMPYRMAGEEPEHFAQYFVQTLSRGGNPSTYIMGTPGQIPYPCLPVAGEITRFLKRWRHVYAGMTPCAHTGLVRPKQQARSTADHEHATAEFRGVYSALQQGHVPFDVVPQERLADMDNNGSLARYGVLVLPDLGELTPDTARTLDEFVARGGRVLATGSTGFGADGSVQLACLAAEQRLAATTTADLLWSTYIAPRDSSDVSTGDRNSYAGPIAPIYGAYHYCAWRDGAEQRLKMLARAPFGPPEKAYGHQQVDHPGYVMWRHGQGRSATIPWTVGRGYRELGLTVERDLILAIVRDLLGDDEPVSVDLPEQVEVTVHKNGERTIVHLVNMSGARSTGFGKPLPIRNGTLRMRGASGSTAARALVSDTACIVAADADGITVALPELNLFEVIVIGESEEINK